MYGLSDTEVAELARLDAERRARVCNAEAQGRLGYAYMRIPASRPHYIKTEPTPSRRDVALGCGTALMLVLAAALVLTTPRSTWRLDASPVVTGEHARAVEDWRDLRNERERRAHSTDRAAAGSAPVISPTPTVPPYCCGGGLGVVPPEYVATPTAEIWIGAGGGARK